MLMSLRALAWDTALTNTAPAPPPNVTSNAQRAARVSRFRSVHQQGSEPGGFFSFAAGAQPRQPGNRGANQHAPIDNLQRIIFVQRVCAAVAGIPVGRDTRYWGFVVFGRCQLLDPVYHHRIAVSPRRVLARA